VLNPQKGVLDFITLILIAWGTIDNLYETDLSGVSGVFSFS
jgi:hypothetical protein